LGDDVIKLMTRRIYRKALTALERGDLDSLLAAFDDRCTLTFVGDTPLGAKLSTPAGIRLWFERFGRLLPNATFHIEHTVISGPLWNQRLAAHVTIRSTIDGEPYENQFAHFLRLRWGNVVDDLIIEDTQRWDRACRRLVATGVSEAGEPPMIDGRCSVGVGPGERGNM
jgi:ketosteroid isomerase-like protein